jgi:hypothetical protein
MPRKGFNGEEQNSGFFSAASGLEAPIRQIVLLSMF